MAYNEKCARSHRAPMHQYVFGATLCGIILTPKWHVYRFGGPADCKRCNKIEEEERREAMEHLHPLISTS